METLASDWPLVLRVVLAGVVVYSALVAFLRISGKRTLSKMNAYDFIVTIALGSTLSSSLLNKDLALLHIVTAFALLIGLQYLVSWTTVRSRLLASLLRSDPSVLFHDGRYVDDALRKHRVTRDDIRAAVRAAGHPDLSDVGTVVLETDGGMSIVRAASPGGQAGRSGDTASALAGLRLPDRH